VKPGAERVKLRAEDVKLRAERVKLRAEGVKLRAERTKLRAERVKLGAEGVKLRTEGVKLRGERAKLGGLATFLSRLRIRDQSDITLVSHSGIQERENVIMIREREYNGIPGLGMLLLFFALFLGAVGGLVYSAHQGWGGGCIASALLMAAAILGECGLFIVNPNQAKVLQFFGDYVGTARRPGLRWANPFYSKKRVSARTRNFETAKLKVNDKAGNPIEIAAIVVWRVIDTAEALFNVDDYINFVQVQSESALRNLATHFPYVADVEGEMDLSGHTSEMSVGLAREIQERLEQAGVAVIEARISHLAYSPEIASAMLQRQQASAVVAARAKIVEGAVGMVENALEMLAARGLVDLDPERRAAMVSNLLVVLCGGGHPQPVVNVGSLYH
jgi:regulator of protease activity HflC (stomatin/prohibitin superfamily)